MLGKGKHRRVHAMNGVILRHGIKRRWVFSFTTWDTYSPDEEEPLVHGAQKAGWTLASVWTIWIKE